MEVLGIKLVLTAVGRTEVVLCDGPDDPGEMLSQLEGLFLLHEVGEGVLHSQSIFHMGLKLVTNPVAVAQRQNILR